MEELSQESYRTILEAMPTGVYLVDRQRRIILWSSGAGELTGYLRLEVVGRPCRDDLLIHCDDNDSCVCGVGCPMQQTMRDGEAKAADLVLLHKDGRRAPVSVRVFPLRDDRGAIAGAVQCFDRRLVSPIQ